MVGNVNNIVEPMFAADNIKNQQSTASDKSGNSFSDYLDLLLLNSRSGLLTGGLTSGYSYMNGYSDLTGSIWQMTALKALKEKLEKKQETNEPGKSEQEESGMISGSVKKKQADWATIRVIRHYQPPNSVEDSKKRGILV